MNAEGISSGQLGFDGLFLLYYMLVRFRSYKNETPQNQHFINLGLKSLVCDDLGVGGVSKMCKGKEIGRRGKGEVREMGWGRIKPMERQQREKGRRGM